MQREERLAALGRDGKAKIAGGAQEGPGSRIPDRKGIPGPVGSAKILRDHRGEKERQRGSSREEKPARNGVVRAL